MLRTLVPVVATLSFTIIGAMAYTANNDNNAINEAYKDIGKELERSKQAISGLQTDVDQYKKILKDNTRTMSEVEAQYEANGKDGLNFNLDASSYSQAGSFGTGLSVDDVLSQSKQAENYYENTNGVATPLVMVSFSMPDTTIKRLVEQMKEVNGSIVFQGFKGDKLDVMMTHISEMGIDSGSMMVDPTLFTRFNVTQVPTFIIPNEPIMPCTNQECETPKHIKVTGDVSLDYVFDLVERTGTKEDKAVISKYRS